MLFTKKPNAAAQPEINRHFIFVEIPIEFTASYAIQWGQGAWWPEKCPLRFIKETDGETQIGTRFRLEMENKKVPVWQVEVTNLKPNRLLEHTFHSGMFIGREVIAIGERANGTRIDYELHYQIPQLLNRILWLLLYRKKHDQNIELVLLSLKDYVLKQYQRAQDGTNTDEKEGQA
jgi:hypothetical protein